MGVETETEIRGRGRREEKGERKKVVFLLRASSSKEERYNEDDDSDSGIEYCRLEFHALDLDLNMDDDNIELRRDVLPSLLSQTTTGKLLSLSPSSFSVFGGFHEFLSASPKPPRYMGAATINLNLNLGRKMGWEAFPLQYRKYNAHIPICGVLGGKLYNFGCTSLTPEVFDPSLGSWKHLPLPSDLHCTSPSYPVVADPSNNRILIHFYCHSQLFAFYPDSDGGKWVQLMNRDYFPWAETVAVANDLLFLYEFPMFLIYDLSTGDRMDVVWSSNVCDNVVFDDIDFDLLLHLGNGLMCFTLSNSEAPPVSTSTVDLFFFTVHRCVDSTSVVLRPLSFHSKLIQSTDRVLDILPLSQEAASKFLGSCEDSHNVVE